ncbi:MAG: NAD-dependent epimerase/dehydratase family protein [Patescibacteria group bacterium]
MGLKNKNVLITGGLGFIGSNLAIKLVELGANVEVYDSLIKNFGGNTFNVAPVKSKLIITIADLRDVKRLKGSVKGKAFIFNLAGNLSHIDSMKDPFMDIDINCRAQLCLLEACRENNPTAKIIFAGTRNQYGRALYMPVDEKHLQEPTDINGINSIAAEKYHLLYNRIYKIPAVSLRMTNTFGPRHQMAHSRQGVLNWFIRLIMDNKQVELYGDGLQIRDVNYVDDVVEALVLAAISKKTSGQIYNLGGHPITLKEFVQEIIDTLGKGSFKVIGFPKDRKSIEIGSYVADISKIKEDLGWEPRTHTADGVLMTINYYLKNKKKYW